jgi:glycosyltransferase involved in cell wall biosynthesis
MSASFAETSEHPIIVLPSGRIARLLKFKTQISEWRPSAIIFHFFNIDQALMAAIASLSGTNRIIAAAGTAAVDLSPATREKWRLALAINYVFSIPIVSASLWIHDTLSSLRTLPKNSLVIHNGVEFSKFRADVKVQRSLSRRSGWVLGMIARLDIAKDHETLIRGFAQFVEQDPLVDAQLRIIGDGPLRWRLERLVECLGQENRISFCGTRMNIPGELQELDTFVFSTTKKEGFGNVLIEALAARVPVIANDVPSSREVLQNGRYGRLVKDSSPAGWADALRRYWLDEPKTLPPEVDTLEAKYGIEQFGIGYLELLNFDRKASDEV